MHSMPAVTAAPNGKVVACQSLDNKIVIYQVGDRFKEMRKKVFKGHMVAGYACGVDFSPEMSYLASGDGDGKVLCVNLTIMLSFKPMFARSIFGTGRPPSCCPSGRLTTMFASKSCGTPTRLARSPLRAGTEISSSGTEKGRRGEGRDDHQYCCYCKHLTIIVSR